VVCGFPSRILKRRTGKVKKQGARLAGGRLEGERKRLREKKDWLREKD
jgi:hypothetical protein